MEHCILWWFMGSKGRRFIMVDNFQENEILGARKLNKVLYEVELNRPVPMDSGKHTHASLEGLGVGEKDGLLDRGMVSYVGGVSVIVQKFNAWLSDGSSYELSTDTDRDYKTVTVASPVDGTTYYLVASVNKTSEAVTLSFEETVSSSTTDIYYRAISNVVVSETSNGYVFSEFNYKNKNWIGGDIYEGDPNEYHFKVNRVSDTSVEVHCGQRIRYAAGSIYRIGLTNDANAKSQYYDDVRTISGIGESGFIIITLNNDLVPTALDASFTNAYPNDLGNVIIVLASVTWDSVNSKISSIEPYWVGGDRYDQWIIVSDTNLDYDDDQELQIKGWKTAESVSWSNLSSGDLLPFQDISEDLNLKYMDLDSLTSYIQNNLTLVENWVDLGDTVGALGDNNDLVTVNGAVLDFVSREDAGDGIWWKLNNVELDDAYGAVIGRTDAIKAIDLTNMRLHTSGTKDDITNWTIDWNLKILATGGQENLSWDTTSVDVHADTFLKSLNTGDVTSPYKTSDLNSTESLYVAGGLGVAKELVCKGLHLHIEGALDNFITATSAQIQGQNTITIHASGTPGNLLMTGDAAGTFNANAMSFGVTTSNTVNGNLCPANLSGWFRHGWFTNEDSASIQTIEVPDGSGGTRQIKVLALNV